MIAVLFVVGGVVIFSDWRLREFVGAKHTNVGVRSAVESESPLEEFDSTHDPGPKVIYGVD